MRPSYLQYSVLCRHTYHIHIFLPGLQWASIRKTAMGQMIVSCSKTNSNILWSEIKDEPFCEVKEVNKRILALLRTWKQQSYDGKNSRRELFSPFGGIASWSWFKKPKRIRPSCKLGFHRSFHSRISLVAGEIFVSENQKKILSQIFAPDQ